MRLPPASEAIDVMGASGALPLLEALAQAWVASGHTPDIRIERGVDSAGGVRAAADGAVDLGVVARELEPGEAREGLDYLRLGTDAVVLATHPDVHVPGLSREDVRALYEGERTRFDDGTEAILLLAPLSESANATFEQMVPGVARARAEAYQQHRFRSVARDADLARLLSRTPGGIGLTGLSASQQLRPPLRVLAVDGITPSLETLAKGTWRASRPLGFVVRRDRRSRVQPFLDFVFSPAGQAVTRAVFVLPRGKGG